MADEQELLEEGWQARDLRSGVAKVFQEAKRRCVLGIRVASVWSIMMLVYAVLDMAGVATVAPPIWEFAAALAVMLFAALAMSRTPGPLLAAGAMILGDLVVVAYRLPELFEHGETIDLSFTAVRITLAPVALSMVLNGYFGALSIQAFKLGFSPGADWRTRINPMMMQLVVIGSCVGALVVGVTTWFGAINAGFSQPGGAFNAPDPVAQAIEARSAAESNSVMPFSEPASGEDVQEYPEAAIPIETLDGLDTFGQRSVEEAFEFAEKTDEAGCLLEGQGRQDRCRDERCRHWARVFVRACLPKSRKVPAYCEQVPEPTRITPGLEWAQRLCAGRNFETCREILYAVQGHCHPPGTVGVAVKGEGTKKPDDSNVLKESVERTKNNLERATKAMKERR